MNTTNSKRRHIAFLRGINVGGHHKVPMKELQNVFSRLKFKKVHTILNSGNIIFEGNTIDETILEKIISEALEEHFGFTIPTIVRNSEFIESLIRDSPFKNIEVTKDIRLYVSFLKDENDTTFQLPWKNDELSYQILNKINKTIFSVLDVSTFQTIKAMEILEKTYGKNITTRNWNTIERIGKKLNP